MEVWMGYIFHHILRSLRVSKRKENSQLVESEGWEIKVVVFQVFVPQITLFVSRINLFTLERWKGMISYLLVYLDPVSFQQSFETAHIIIFSLSVTCPETTWWILAITYSGAMYIIVSIHFKLRCAFMQLEWTHSRKIINTKRIIYFQYIPECTFRLSIFDGQTRCSALLILVLSWIINS